MNAKRKAMWLDGGGSTITPPSDQLAVATPDGPALVGQEGSAAKKRKPSASRKPRTAAVKKASATANDAPKTPVLSASTLAQAENNDKKPKRTYDKVLCVKCNKHKGPGAFMHPCDSDCAICKHCSRVSIDKQLKTADKATEIACEQCDRPLPWKQLKRVLTTEKYQEYETKVLVPNPVYYRCSNHPVCAEWEVGWPDRSITKCKMCRDKANEARK